MFSRRCVRERLQMYVESMRWTNDELPSTSSSIAQFQFGWCFVVHHSWNHRRRVHCRLLLLQLASHAFGASEQFRSIRVAIWFALKSSIYVYAKAAAT
jgi:hypothetical protein